LADGADRTADRLTPARRRGSSAVGQSCFGPRSSASSRRSRCCTFTVRAASARPAPAGVRASRRRRRTHAAGRRMAYGHGLGAADARRRGAQRPTSSICPSTPTVISSPKAPNGSRSLSL